MSFWGIVTLSLFLQYPIGAQSEPVVVATIKPIHSIAAYVMGGVAEPHLIMKGHTSPHTFNLRPSDARALDNAQVVFKVSDAMEMSLIWPLRTLAYKANIVSLAHAKDLVRRPWRQGGAFEDHGLSIQNIRSLAASSRDEDDHFASHAIDPHAAPFDDTQNMFVDVIEDPMDMHIWLDPRNAQTIATTIAYVLSEVDPEHAEQYEANRMEFSSEIGKLDAELVHQLADATGRPFLVFHDGYRYFEDRFGLTAVGSAVVTPDRSPGARRIRELQQRIVDLGVVCVFSEPQFDRKVVDTITEGTEVRVGVLDPLGAEVEDGAALYPTLMRNLGSSFASCLGPT